MAISRRMITERKAARIFVKFSKAWPTCKSTLPLRVIIQLQKLGFRVRINALISKDIHKHRPTNTAAKKHPINVIFFQSELRWDEQVKCVSESTETKLTSTIFLAVFGVVPHNDPCLIKICCGGFSKVILQSFLAKAAFTTLYVLLISELTVRSSNRWHHLV